MRSAVVVNPVKVPDMMALRHEVGAALADAGCLEPLWLETKPSDSGRGQTRTALEAGVDVVFAIGGDGTVMACVTELTGTAVALAVVPAGTGNLLAANLNLPSDVAECVAVAVGPGRRRIDVGVTANHCFVVMAGMGFDATMITDAAEATKAKLGWPAYVVSGLKHLRDRRVDVSIQLDDRKPLRRRVRAVLIANVGTLPGGIELLPDAVPDDGVLDVAVLSPRTLRDWLGLAWDVLHHRSPPSTMEIFRARRVTVHSDRPQAREVDGDPIDPARDLTVEVLPRALTLCVPT